MVKGDLGGPLSKKMVILLRRNFSRGPTTISCLKNFSHFLRHAKHMVPWFPDWLFPLSEGAPNVSPDLCHVILRPLHLTHLLWLPVNTGNSSYLEKEKTNKFSSVEKCVLRTYESGKALHVWREQEKKIPGGAARWAHVGC